MMPSSSLPKSLSSPTATRALNNVPMAALLMIIGSVCFVTVAALVKLACREATPMQAVLYRSFFSSLPTLLAMRLGHISVFSRKWRLLFLRGFIGFCALYCYLWSVAHIYLSDVLALQQMSPIFVALLSIKLLGEMPRRSHLLFTGICLLGAVLVIRPTRGLASLDSSVALLSALFSSGAYVAVSALTKTEHTLRIVLWFSMVSSVLSIPFVLPAWRWLSLSANLFLILAGLTAALAQTLMTAAYRRAPAHLSSAFSYFTVPTAYLVGLLFWGEKPDSLAHLGIALIVIGGVIIVLSVGFHRSRSSSSCG